MSKAKLDDDDKFDESREEDERHGPNSIHIDLSSTEDTPGERDELALLRVENSLLRKKIKKLEKAGRGEKKLGVDETEIQRIDALLKKAEVRKVLSQGHTVDFPRVTSSVAADAFVSVVMRCAIGRETRSDELRRQHVQKQGSESFSVLEENILGQDVKVLQAILKKAKAERHSFKKKIKSTEEKLQQERKTIEQEEVCFQVDREIFAKILKDDRDSYKYEVNLLVQKMTELQKEKHELFVWAKEQQERHLQEIRKLTRALGRTRKAIDEQKAKGMDVLSEVYRVQAGVFPNSGRERVSSA